jgi:tetratricopeptide (TPR) repeat protein
MHSHKTVSWDLALANIEKCLEIRLKVLDEEHPDIAESYNSIGLVYDSKGQYDLALENYEKCLEIDLKTLGRPTRP